MAGIPNPSRFNCANRYCPCSRNRFRYSSAIANDSGSNAASAARWAHRWGASYSNLGAVGHINAEAGFGPLPMARSWVEAARARHAAELRPRHAEFREWAFAV